MQKEYPKVFRFDLDTIHVIAAIVDKAVYLPFCGISRQRVDDDREPFRLFAQLIVVSSVG
jgi:hypothetical protein